MYPRVPYKAEGVESVKKKALFGGGEFVVPAIDAPITPVENFKLSWKRQTPIWAPNTLVDFDMISMGKTSSFEHLKQKNERFDFVDAYGCEWTYVHEVGGAMLKPGTCLLEDILDWENVVELPDWSSRAFIRTQAEEFHKNRKNPNSVLAIDIGSVGTEVLISLLGGYEQGMMAMAMEPEAFAELMYAINENMAKKFDLVLSLYPSVDMITFHDDWANEKDAFFSEKYLEVMVYGPTKKLIDHIKAAGDYCVEFHCCGNMGRFIPYIIDLGVDLLQIQSRANDFRWIKQNYGDKIGFGSAVEGIEPGVNIAREEWLEKIRRTIDLYGGEGGFYLSSMGFPRDEELLWDICFEAYCYSREYYDKKRA